LPQGAAVVVRDAAAADLEAIAAIYAHHVTHGLGSFELEPPSVEDMRGRFETIRAGGYPFLVAVAEDRVLGYAYAGPYRPRHAYRFTAEDSVYVAPDAQGRGVGAALLGGVIERLRAKGIRQVIAVIGDSGNQGSIGLHRKLGFRDVGVFRSVGWKHDRWVDTVLMQLELPPG
jgi:phosphinothricin acetyltransferase